MARLSFKKQYVDPILRGEKVQTLRASTAIAAGEIVPAYCAWGKPPFAWLRVESVEWVDLWEIDDELAAADGFTCAQELREALARFYPGVERFAKLAFTVVEPEGAT